MLRVWVFNGGGEQKKIKLLNTRLKLTLRIEKLTTYSHLFFCVADILINSCYDAWLMMSRGSIWSLVDDVSAFGTRWNSHYQPYDCLIPFFTRRRLICTQKHSCVNLPAGNINVSHVYAVCVCVCACSTANAAGCRERHVGGPVVPRERTTGEREGRGGWKREENRVTDVSSQFAVPR